jgi:hypothetical protein
MRRLVSRERRRQGDVIVKLEIGPNMTADLADLGWLPAPDRVDKNAFARALTSNPSRRARARASREIALSSGMGQEVVSKRNG